MSRVLWLPILGLAGLLAMASSAQGQPTPYIGFVYPAGGQQGTTFQVKLGGQRLDGVDAGAGHRRRASPPRWSSTTGS